MPWYCRNRAICLTAMVGRRRGVFLAAALAVKLAALCGCSGAIAQEQPNGMPICGGDVIARGVAKHVIDGRSFTLDDGREVRLAAIEVAPLESGAAPAAGAPTSQPTAMAASSPMPMRCATARNCSRKAN